MRRTKVAVCQVPEIREDVDAALSWIEKFTGQAEDEGVSLICFPECFLQGYRTDKADAQKQAIDLASNTFGEICRRLSKYKLTIVFGMIEAYKGNLFNTAIVLKQGKLLGKYRKVHLLPGESVFTAGFDYPVFEAGGIKFGINICYDTQFREAAAALARQQVQLILCPANNMMRYDTAEKYRYLHHEMRSKRAKEAGAWLLSSDITGERDGCISYGPTSVIDTTGQVITQVPLFETGMVVAEI